MFPSIAKRIVRSNRLRYSRIVSRRHESNSLSPQEHSPQYSLPQVADQVAPHTMVCLNFNERLISHIQDLFDEAIDMCHGLEAAYPYVEEGPDFFEQLVSNLLTLQELYSKILPAHEITTTPTAAAAAADLLHTEAAGDESMSLKEFALFAVKNSVNEEDLKSLKVMFTSSHEAEPASLSDTTSLDEKKQIYKDALELKFNTENIYNLSFRKVIYEDGSKITKSQALDLFVSNYQLRKELKGIFANHMTTLNDPKYIHGLVSVNNEEAVAFPSDLGKSKACIISGEEGVGKSWFTKKSIPSKFPDASIIYYEVTDEDEDIQPPPREDDIVSQTHRDSIKEMRHERHEVFDAVCELARRKNSPRNQAAINMMDTFVRRSLQSSTLASTWWECFSHDNKTASCEPLDQLIIIFDNAGYIPEFTLGLVDEVRHLLIKIHNKGLAKRTLLVLVGSDLDVYIDNSSRSQLWSAPDDKKYKGWPSFGADPSKADLISISRPVLDDSGTRGKRKRFRRYK